MSRYQSDKTVKRGLSLGTAKAAKNIRKAYNSGNLSTTTIVTGAGARLDQIAYSFLGDPSYWWAIAALSGIGWGLQIPHDTRLIVPTKIDEVKGLE